MPPTKSLHSLTLSLSRKKNRELERQAEELSEKLRSETQARDRAQQELQDIRAALDGELRKAQGAAAAGEDAKVCKGLCEEKITMGQRSRWRRNIETEMLDISKIESFDMHSKNCVLKRDTRVQ